MSQFSDLVKEAIKRYPGGRAAGGSGITVLGAAPRKPRANLADMLQKKWGAPVPHPDGQFDALAEKVVVPHADAAIAKGVAEAEAKKAIEAATAGTLKQRFLSGARKRALEYLDGKVLPGVLAATVGTAGTVVAAKHVAPWISNKLSPKQSLMQKLLKSPATRKLLMAGAGATALAGGLAMGEKLHNRVSDDMSKRRGFKRLMDHSPHLVKQDPKHVAELYEALHAHAPSLAKNPLTASSFIKTRLQYKDEGLQPMDIKTLTEIQKNRADRGKGDSFLGKIFGPAATVSGMAGLHGGDKGE